jgi:hypothetical protein
MCLADKKFGKHLNTYLNVQPKVLGCKDLGSKQALKKFLGFGVN